VVTPMDVDELDRIDGVEGAHHHHHHHHHHGSSHSHHNNNGNKRKKGAAEEEIPGLSLGEPEEAVPEHHEFEKRPRAVHVNSSGSGHGDEEDETAGMTPEEREKHRRFEEMRKKHYEMKNVAKFLGHPEELEDPEEEEEEDGDVPPVPRA
jgi:protein phosphatase inhibitor 2